MGHVYQVYMHLLNFKLIVFLNRSPIALSPSVSINAENLDRWENRHVQMLICCWKENKSFFGNGKSTKKEVFEKIATDFNAKSDLKVSGSQCLRKWAKLEAKQKEIVDHNNKSGNGTRTWKYYAQMEDCIGGQSNVNPTFTLESSSSSVISDYGESSSEDDGNLSATPNKKKAPSKRPLKKRRSRSSASEMLEFLREYQGKKEEVENKKLKILQEMNEEKKAFWSNLLEVMKTTKE